jgi:D-3-phosphoglycerate dehydrogenase
MLAKAGFEVAEAHARTPAAVIDACRGATALLVTAAPITRAVLEALPEVRIVVTASVGVDHIDLDAARDGGIWVCNTPDAATEEVAIHAFAMMLALVRQLPAWDRHVRSGGWAFDAVGTLRRPSLMTLGVLGLGRIGRRLAELARPAFGRILAYDPYLAAEEWPAGIARSDLDEVFASADALSLHLPLTSETRQLVNARRLGSMKRHSYLVNVARGDLVDTSALLQALDEGRLAGAALDVLPTEPPDRGDPLLRHPRVLLSPHAAFYSDEAMRQYFVKQAQDVIAWRETGKPINVIVEGRSE